jgi:HlyD family secretion protein
MFARLRSLVFNLGAVFVALVVLSSFLFASYQLETWPFGDHRTLRERHQFTRVSRTVLEPVLRAPGRVESSRRTIVRCELENMTSTGGSTSTGGGGSSTMIWVVGEATTVKQGDLIARLDASTYEEMLRQQTILVEQAKASHLQAELNLEIAKIALREYIEGTVKEMFQQMEANLSLAKSNVTQAGQRLEWSRKMNQKGYLSIAQIKTDEQTFMTTELQLQQQESSFDLFKRFTYPKNEKTLQADITTAQTTLDNEQVKLNRQVERFETLKKQVGRCAIRAPHDGIVYYYVDPNPRRGPNQETALIQEGMSVRQEQKLFYLPDLSEMEIQVVLNESVVNRVTRGLTGNVEFEALPGTVISGTLVSISEIPNQVNERGEDVRYFMGILKLDRSAEGLKPGMSAIVTLTLPRGQGSLVVPPAAVISDQGRYSCYLPVADHLELRDVKVGRTTPEVIEITDGLNEGDEIALDPPTTQSTSRPRSLAGFDSRPWPKDAISKADLAPPPAGSSNRRAYGNGNGESRQGKGTPGKGGRRSRKPADDDA